MEKTLTRTELEAQLDGKSESISRRLQALQEEVTSFSVRDMVRRRPWIGVAGAIAGGVLIGLMLGGKRKPGTGTAALHTALIDGYVDAIAGDVRRLTGKGREVSEAVAEALRERVPVILYAPEDGQPKRGLVGQTADLAFKAAAGFAVKAAIDYATTKIDVATMLTDLSANAEAEAGMAETIVEPPSDFS